MKPRIGPPNQPHLQGTEERPPEPGTPPGGRGEANRTRHACGDQGQSHRPRHASRGPRTGPPNPARHQGAEERPPEPATHAGDREQSPRPRHASRGPRTGPPNLQRLDGMEDRPPNLATPQATEHSPTEPTTPPGDQGQASRTRHTSSGPQALRTSNASMGRRQDPDPPMPPGD